MQNVARNRACAPRDESAERCRGVVLTGALQGCQTRSRELRSRRHSCMAQTSPRTRTPPPRRPAEPAGYGFLTVGQTARILGVSPSTLRLWENVGLVSPARSNGRYRLYSPDTLKVLKRIKYLRDVQRLNMPGIKRELGPAAPARVRADKRPLGPL